MRFRRLLAPAVVCASLVCGVFGRAQGPKPRLTAGIGSTRVTLPGTHTPAAAMSTDKGAVPASTALKGMTLVFTRSAAQQADLDALLAAQQNPASPLFHKWLTPDQFAARFGVADADIATAKAWLQTQGFQVNGVTRARDGISFDGTAGQVAAAFGTELHRYAHGQSTFFAPSTDLTLPKELAAVVTTVTRLSSLRPQRHLKLGTASVRPAYTSSQSGNHFLTPSDLATMYDMTSTYKAGYNGAGQGVAIIGQSYISTAAVTAFQTGAGLATNAPNFVLVPNSGVAAFNPQSDLDEGESELDVEYAAGMAPGANVYFVYTGDDSNVSVFDSLFYAISQDIAPVISGSYGLCEAEVGTQDVAQLTQILQQASAQGQTVIFSSGDSGSTDCSGYTDLPAAQQTGLAADYPSTSPGITGMGGTQMAAGTFDKTNTQYWQSATGSDVISSLLSYVPETVWNEDSASSGLLAGGGGVSTLFTRPTWQAGVPGISAGTMRLTPDISIQASVSSPGYIYCTADPGDLSGEGVTASCTNGLRSPAGTFMVAGGTSFAAPAFAGMLAVLNQVKHENGQGNINPTLYTLAANATTYGSAFHDVSTGTNACTAGATLCSTIGASAFAAGTGYDNASGLGSIDFANLVAAWPSSSGTALNATTVVVSPATATPSPGATDQITITVNPQNGSGATPTGTLQLVVNGATVTPTLALTNGTAGYTFTVPSVLGTYAITAVYSGDANFAASTGTATVTAGSPTASGTFALTALPVTVPYNSTASTTFTITPGSGYTGTVVLSLTYPSGAPTLCYQVNPNSYAGNVALPTGKPVTGTLLIGEGTACGTSATGAVVLRGTGQASVRGEHQVPSQRRVPEAVAFAGLLFTGLAFRRSRRLPALLCLGFMAAIGVGLSGCSSSSTGTTTTPPPATKQTLSIGLTGTDSVNTSITNSVSFTVTVQ